MKAYIHKGKALLALQRYDESLECFDKAQKVEPDKQRIIQGECHVYTCTCICQMMKPLPYFNIETPLDI